jgi:alanine racemase
MRQIQVNLSAIVANYRALKERTDAKICAVVKANAYGHGMHEVAQALDGIADVLGVADLEEALELRAAGIKGRIMCWILTPEDDFQLAVESDIELGVSNFEVLDRIPGNAKLHLKVDTGLGRNGFSESDWPRLFERFENQEIQGLFSHLSNTSEAEDLKQQQKFENAVELAKSYRVSISERHLAATAATISFPQMHYEMVRCGIGIYGLTPFESEPVSWLSPALQASSKIVNLKKVPAGQGVSYGYLYRTSKPTTLALVPFGYGEGMPRVSEGFAVSINGQLHPIVGRIAMDQFVVDVGDHEVALGDQVIIFGPGGQSAEALAASAGTINYEIVTRIGGRANRVYLKA